MGLLRLLGSLGLVRFVHSSYFGGALPVAENKSIYTHDDHIHMMIQQVRESVCMYIYKNSAQKETQSSVVSFTCG